MVSGVVAGTLLTGMAGGVLTSSSVQVVHWPSAPQVPSGAVAMTDVAKAATTAILLNICIVPFFSLQV